MSLEFLQDVFLSPSAFRCSRIVPGGWLIMRKIGPPQAPAAAGPAAYSPRLGPTRVPCLPTPTPPSQGEGWCLSASPCGRRCSPAPPRCRHDPDPTALSLGHVGTRRTWAGLATRSQPRVRSCNRAPHGTLLLSLCASFSGYSAAPTPHPPARLWPSRCVCRPSTVFASPRSITPGPPRLSLAIRLPGPVVLECPRHSGGRPPPHLAGRSPFPLPCFTPSRGRVHRPALSSARRPPASVEMSAPCPPPHCKGGVFTARALASTPSSLHTCSGSTRRSRRRRPVSFLSPPCGLGSPPTSGRLCRTFLSRVT